MSKFCLCRQGPACERTNYERITEITDELREFTKETQRGKGAARRLRQSFISAGRGRLANEEIQEELRVLKKK